MPTRLLLALALVVTGCAPKGASGVLSPEHAAAIRDSVTVFLDGYAAGLSDPPIGSNARAALSRFYDTEVVMSADLGAPDDTMLIQTLDSLIPPDELVRQPGWIKSTKLVWQKPVIRPLAPGLAMFATKYAEQVTDTGGTVHTLPGVQQGVVKNTAAGWRLVAIQSAHPPATHQRHSALLSR